MNGLPSVVAGYDGWGHMDGWGGGWMWVMGLAMMVLVTVLIVWVVRVSVGRPPERPDPSDRAREILAERYARGEISTEEYRERLGQLQ